MTTNVYDSLAGTMSSDSRWSCQHGKYLIYIDDARFEKIEKYQNSVFMFAGDGAKIQAWKDWIRTSPKSTVGTPDCEKICICIADQSKNSVIFMERQDIIKDGGYFAGSGSRYAYQCWDANRDPLRAVETAKSFDASSGGDVKFLEFSSGNHNLFSPTGKDVRIEDVSRAMATRGRVMEITVNNATNSPPFKLADVAANDAGLRDVQNKIASGQLSPTAPCDGMHSEWTDEQKRKLDSALGQVFGWNGCNLRHIEKTKNPLLRVFCYPNFCMIKLYRPDFHKDYPAPHSSLNPEPAPEGRQSCLIHQKVKLPPV